MCQLTSRGIFASFFALILFTTASFASASSIYGRNQACNLPLGIQDGQIPDSHLTASSYASLFTGQMNHVDMKAKYGRLNHKYAWCTNKGKKVQQWLMVDLGQITNMTSIATQGFPGVHSYYVRTFKLAYSINGSSWKFIGKAGTDTVFVGNKGGSDIKKNNFGQIQARYIRVLPIRFFIRICLRIELYGCVQGSSITTSTTPTTPVISTSKISSSTKYPTSILTSTTQTPTATTTSFTTKATSIRTTATTSIYPTATKKSSSKSPSSYITGTPSYQHTTAMPLSYISKGSSAVVMTTVLPSGELVTINAFHDKSVKDEDDDEKKKFIIAGVSIFAGLLFLVLLPLLIFWIIRKRKRSFNVNSQLVDLPEYPYHSQVNLNDSAGHSFDALGNDSILVEV